MKKVLSSILGWSALPFLIFLMFARDLGLVFAVSLVATAIAGWGFDIPTALAYFAIAWRVYVAFGVFTFAFLTTFSFQHCCVGLQSFRSHLRHKGLSDVGRNVFGAIIWPLNWFFLDRNLRGWGMSLAVAFCGAVEYWFVNSWRGVLFTQVNMRSGEMTTTRLKTSKDTQRAISDALTEGILKNKRT